MADIKVNDVFVSSYNEAARVLAVVTDNDKTFVIYRYGRMKGGEYRADSETGNPLVRSLSSFQATYSAKHDPDRFKKGDILVNEDGKLFFYSAPNRVWSVSEMDYDDTPRAYWGTLSGYEEKHGKLSKLETGGGGVLGTIEFDRSNNW